MEAVTMESNTKKTQPKENLSLGLSVAIAGIVIILFLMVSLLFKGKSEDVIVEERYTKELTLPGLTGKIFNLPVDGINPFGIL